MLAARDLGASPRAAYSSMIGKLEKRCAYIFEKGHTPARTEAQAMEVWKSAKKMEKEKERDAENMSRIQVAPSLDIEKGGVPHIHDADAQLDSFCTIDHLHGTSSMSPGKCAHNGEGDCQDIQGVNHICDSI